MRSKKASHGLDPIRVDALVNPTMEKALALWNPALGPPIGDSPLAGLHKARLKWVGSTKKMIKESEEWLQIHGYGVDPTGPDSTVPMAKSYTKNAN
jgi:hypothetical protein